MYRLKFAEGCESFLICWRRHSVTIYTRLFHENFTIINFGILILFCFWTEYITNINKTTINQSINQLITNLHLTMAHVNNIPNACLSPLHFQLNCSANSVLIMHFIILLSVFKVFSTNNPKIVNLEQQRFLTD